METRLFSAEPGREQSGCVHGGRQSAPQSGGSEGQTETVQERKQGEGRYLAPWQALQPAISNTLLICRGSDSQASAQCFDFHKFQQSPIHIPVLLLSLHPSAP